MPSVACGKLSQPAIQHHRLAGRNASFRSHLVKQLARLFNDTLGRGVGLPYARRYSYRGQPPTPPTPQPPTKTAGIQRHCGFGGVKGGKPQPAHVQLHRLAGGLQRLITPHLRQISPGYSTTLWSSLEASASRDTPPRRAAPIVFPPPPLRRQLFNDGFGCELARNQPARRLHLLCGRPPTLIHQPHTPTKGRLVQRHCQVRGVSLRGSLSQRSRRKRTLAVRRNAHSAPPPTKERHLVRGVKPAGASQLRLRAAITPHPTADKMFARLVQRRKPGRGVGLRGNQPALAQTHPRAASNLLPLPRNATG